MTLEQLDRAHKAAHIAACMSEDLIVGVLDCEREDITDDLYRRAQRTVEAAFKLIDMAEDEIRKKADRVAKRELHTNEWRRRKDFEDRHGPVKRPEPGPGY